jgi:hypothetical protein
MRALQIDFTSQDYLRNPVASLEQLRRSGPVIQIRFPDIRWRKRPGLRAIEKLPVVARPLALEGV